MEERKQWIEHHKDPPKSCRLLGFCRWGLLVFMIHRLKPYQRPFVSLSRCKKQANNLSFFFKRAGSKTCCIRACRGEGKYKSWVTLFVSSKKFGKAASFTQEDTSFEHKSS